MGTPVPSDGAMGHHLARTSTVRRLLAVRIAPAELRRHPSRDHDRGRVGRRVPEQLAADLRGPDGAETADRRAVGARGNRHLPPGTEHRPGARDAQVVGPLAQGHRQRGGPGAADRAVRAAFDPSGRRSSNGKRHMALRTHLARCTAHAGHVGALPRAREHEPRGSGPLGGSRRRGRHGLDQLRGTHAVRSAHGPAPG